METKAKQWLRIGADYNRSFWDSEGNESRRYVDVWLKASLDRVRAGGGDLIDFPDLHFKCPWRSF